MTPPIYSTQLLGRNNGDFTYLQENRKKRSHFSSHSMKPKQYKNIIRDEVYKPIFHISIEGKVMSKTLGKQIQLYVSKG